MKKRLIIILTVVIIGFTGLKASDFRWTGGRWWGVSVSYSLKWFRYSSGGRHHNCNYFGEDGLMQGIRFGVPVEPVFYKGIGVSTGVFGTVFSCKNKAETKRIELVGLYFPFMPMYRHDFGSDMNVSVATGPSLTVGLLQTVIDPTDSTKKGYHVRFGDGAPNRVECLWEVSAAFTYRMFRFSAVYSYGLTPHRRFLSIGGLQNDFVTARTMSVSINAGIAF